MPRFHPLTVTDVTKTTRDAVVVSLRPEDPRQFRFTPGQYLTFRHEIDGIEIRRCYSICAGADDGVLQVGIKRVSGGAFSTWANEVLAAGDMIEAMPPMGAFHAAAAPARRYMAFAGGSGITPILSILKTVLVREPDAKFALVYANRQVGTIMFREEIEDLKNQYLGRLSVIHVLEAEGQEIDLFTGRLDAGKMDALLSTWIEPASLDVALICGPRPMMEVVQASLLAHGVPEDRVRIERFTAAQPGRLPLSAVAREAAGEDATCDVTVTLDGAARTFRMPRDGTAVVDGALAHGIDVPYACKAGVCSTCRAKVLDGAAEMTVNHALEDYEVRAGYVLSCQCVPLGVRLVLSYDV